MIEKFEPTLKEKSIAARAARRWGMTGPSFGDIIDEAVPSYRCQDRRTAKNGNLIWEKNRTPCSEPGAIERWKNLKDYAINLVEEVPDGTGRKCANCGKLLNKRQKILCSSACNNPHMYKKKAGKK